LGSTIDMILYDGVISKGDRIVVGSFDGPQASKIRALLLPKPMNDTMDPEDKFQSVNSVVAAAGVKVVAPSLDRAVGGAPVMVANDDASCSPYQRGSRRRCPSSGSPPTTRG